jgi:glycerol-3-phosphate O-acyltransferase
MYYRNALNHIFFNESIVLCAIHSFGLEMGWQLGVDLDALFERACFLSELLKREEFVQHRITKGNRSFFDQVIKLMIDKRILLRKKQENEEPNLILLRTSGESQIVFIQSLVFPLIDSYYVALIFILTFIKNKGIPAENFTKSVQWLSELLFKQGSIQFFESCNVESIKNAMATFVEMGILSK